MKKWLISNRCISGLMSYLIKKSWTDSTPDLLGKSLVTHSFFPDLSINNLAAIFLCRNIYRNKSRNLLTLPFHLYIMYVLSYSSRDVIFGRSRSTHFTKKQSCSPDQSYRIYAIVNWYFVTKVVLLIEKKF